MAHFTQDYLDFFSELQANNHKDWFHANKKRYEKSVKKPFAAFVEHMIDRIAEHDPEVRIAAKDATMRINRDIRFSPDKTPYNTSMRAIISAVGRKDRSYPGIFFKIDAEGVGFFGGAYMLEKEKLRAVREHIADDLEAFARLISDPEFKAKFGEIRGEKNKRLPKEFQEAAAKQPLLFNKGFYYHTQIGPEHVLSDDLPDTMMEYWHVARPMQQFLLDALGLD